MAPLTSLAVGDYVTARIFTYHGSNRSREFQNTYEFAVNAIDPSLSQYESLANAIAEFHMAMHAPACVIDRVVLSTYEAEEGGYDPESFFTLNVNNPGTRIISGDLLPANVVLYAKRLVNTGRSGKLHLRLVLTEGDIVAPAGIAALANAPALSSELNTALTDSTLGEYFGLAPAKPFRMAMVSQWGTPPVLGDRPVQGMIVAGVRVTSPNHAYFDVA